jgi:photosystem II stability/assembly factor-like uncharacterized protein
MFIGFAQTTNKIDWTEMSNVKDATFYEVQEAFNQYWENKEVERGKGYKPFKRWEAYMEERVYPSGNMSLTSLTYPNYKKWLRDNESAVNALANRSPALWTELGPVGSPTGPSPYTGTGAGRLNFVHWDPNDNNIMYVGAPDGGLWKSTNAGSSWSTSTDNLAVIGCTDLAIDPTNTSTMYLATGDIEGNKNSIGILKSIDGGTTWNPTSLVINISNGWRLSKLLMDPNNPLRMIASSNVGVWYTTDGWVTNTFSSIGETYPNLKDMELKPGDPNTVYVSGTTIYKSTDFGENWVEVTSGLPTSGVSRIALAVTPANSAYVYALYGQSSDQGYMGMYRSTDSASTFTAMSTSPNLLGYATNGSDSGGQAFYDLSLVASPTDANNITVGGVNHWRSFDGGINWQNTSFWASGEIHADVHDLRYLPGSSTTMYSCNDGGLFISTDNGNQWTDISNNLAIGQVVKLGLSASTQSRIVAGEQDNGTILNETTGWNGINGGDGGECFIDYTDNNIVYVQYVEGAYSRIEYPSGTKTPITSGLPSGIDFYSPFKMDPVNHLRLYSGGTPKLYTSSNQGDNWIGIGNGTGSGTIKDIAIAPSNPSIIYLLQNDAISKSTNSGTTFTDVTGSLPTTVALKSITVSNVDANKVWVTYSGYDSNVKVFKTVDGGTNWTNISAGLPNLPMNTIVHTNNSTQDDIYVGGDVGVYYYNNTLTAFEPYLIGLPNAAVRDLEIFYPGNKLRAGTYGRGVWESDLNDATLGTIDHTFNNSVSVFEDENEKLIISSSLQSITQIKVYDMLGRLLFFKDKVSSKDFTVNSIKKERRVLFVNITLSNDVILKRKIVF